jgi:predicted phosphodiesterase
MRLSARVGALAGLGTVVPIWTRCSEKPLPGLDWSVLAADLVTITEDSAAFMWVTDDERPTAIRYGTDEGVDRYHETGNPPSRFHYLELEGLMPGTTYHYRLSTLSPPGHDEHSPGTFTTLVPPDGDLLFTFATMNDIHVGVDEVGLIFGGGAEGMSWPDPQNPHWRFTVDSAVSRINQSGAEFVIVKGDLTSEFTEEEFQGARELLDRLAVPYYPVRGNHDRVGANPEDFYLRIFGDRLPGGSPDFSFEQSGVKLICLDSSNLQTGEPELSPGQISFLEAEMSSSDSAPVMIFLHHPVTRQATALFALTLEDREAFCGAAGGYDNLTGIFCGHSHRDCITHEDALGAAPCVETAAALHYPSGYNLIRVYSNGYMHTCHTMHCPECLEWTHMTRDLYGGLAVDILFLEASRKNFVYLYG